MTLGNLIGIVLAIVVIGGGILFLSGYLSLDESGVKVDTKSLGEDADSATEVSPFTKAGRYYTSLQYEEALKAYQEALREGKLDLDEEALARYRIAKSYEKTGQPAKAKTAYKAFIKMHPNDKNTSEAKKRLAVL